MRIMLNNDEKTKIVKVCIFFHNSMFVDLFIKGNTFCGKFQIYLIQGILDDRISANSFCT